ncbi:MAG: type IX secretion system protein PorQ [Bacteroidetes bacterium]|nr:type IX secretion system protein PorQ [Bacteroidota bacterium]
MKTKTFFTTVIFFLVTVSIFGQKTYDFLRLDMSPRAGALGGSFVSNNDDPNVIFYNPSGLKLIKDKKISFSYVNHLLDINLASVSYTQDVGTWGRFGAAFEYISYGNFTRADQFGNKIGEFDAGELALIIGYANNLEENFYYGVNIKFINSSIADQSSSAIAFDFGLHYSIPSQGLSFGIALLNTGFQISKFFNTKEDLPLNLVIGVSKKMAHLPLTLSVDFNKLNESDDPNTGRFEAFSVGAEFELSKSFSVRFGYNNEKRKELKIGDFGGLAGFNLGVGLLISKYHFDYGYSSMGDIGSLHRIGISTSL